MQKISEYVIDIKNVFEGPLDLLMHLIRVNELDIRDIPISFILQEYLKYIRTLEQLDIDISSEFLVMVSTLLEIKSRMLLPSSYLENYESDEEWMAAMADPRRELVRALVFNDIHRRIEEELREREEYQARVFPPGNRYIAFDTEVDVSYDLEKIDLYDLLTSYQQLLINEKKHSILIQMPTESLELVIDELRRWRGGEKVVCDFEEAIGKKRYPARVVIVFLAILELVRAGILEIDQNPVTRKISLRWK